MKIIAAPYIAVSKDLSSEKLGEALCEKPHKNLTRQEYISKILKSPVSNLKLLGGGDNIVYLVNNKYVFRMPKNNHAKIANQKEQIVLKELLSCIKTTAIPKYYYWDHDSGIGAYEEIPGEALSFKLYNNLNTQQKYKLAQDLAHVLSEIHEVKINKLNFLSYAHTDISQIFTKINNYILDKNIFSQEQSKKILENLEQIKKILGTNMFSPVFLHSDFHCDNIIINKNKLNGIIDFSDARIGPPVVDFAHLYRVSPQLAEETAMLYAQIRQFDIHEFVRACELWALIWHTLVVLENIHKDTLRNSKRVIRAGRVLSGFFVG